MFSLVLLVLTLMLHTSHGEGQERVNFFRRRHFCSALYGNFLTYVCNELALCFTTLYHIWAVACTVCVFQMIYSSPARTLSALCCTELLMLITSCIDRRLLARASAETKTAFSAKQTNVKDVAVTVRIYCMSQSRAPSSL